MPSVASAKCPICGDPSVAEYRPFCSTRHRDRDLLQWLGEAYRIPGKPIDPDGVDRDTDAD